MCSQLICVKNFSDAKLIMTALKEDLLKAEEKGKSALVLFVLDRLTSSAVENG